MTSVVLVLAACGSKLTEANLQKIHNGITTDEVNAIHCEPTNKESGSLLCISGATYTYHTDTSDVKITFVNDKVMTTEGEFK